MSNLKYITFSCMTDRHGYLHNSFPVKFEVNGVTFKTVEHYYHSQKFEDYKTQSKITRACTKYAIYLGTTLKGMRSDWDTVRLKVMKDALTFKFKSNDEILDRLISTGNTGICYVNKNDLFWGTDSKLRGENNLGRLLMQVRHELSMSLNENYNESFNQAVAFNNEDSQSGDEQNIEALPQIEQKKKKSDDEYEESEQNKEDDINPFLSQIGIVKTTEEDEGISSGDENVTNSGSYDID